jgi:hypothetical protein
MATTSIEPEADLRVELEASLRAFIAEQDERLPPPPESGTVTRIDRRSVRHD